MKCETAFLQNLSELQMFIELLKCEKVKSYLEIGSKHGGSLWYIGKSLPSGSKVVAVDLPHGDSSFKNSQPNLQECVNALRKRMRHQVSVILGDSTSAEVIEEVKQLGPYDACFIDANHTEPYVRKDWANYGPLCRIVAFHDIGHSKPIEKERKQIEVPIVWKELKEKYRHKEIRLDKDTNGIGVLWTT